MTNLWNWYIITKTQKHQKTSMFKLILHTLLSCQALVPVPHHGHLRARLTDGLEPSRDQGCGVEDLVASHPGEGQTWPSKWTEQRWWKHMEAINDEIDCLGFCFEMFPDFVKRNTRRKMKQVGFKTLCRLVVMAMEAPQWQWGDEAVKKVEL